MERTLSIIKPDGVRRGLMGEVIKRFEKNDINIIAMKMVHLTQEDAEILIVQLGLDQPVGIQYLIYLKNFFTGHFGYSFHYGEPVVDIIWNRLPNTILLFTTSIILSAFSLTLSTNRLTRTLCASGFVAGYPLSSCVSPVMWMPYPSPALTMGGMRSSSGTKGR